MFGLIIITFIVILAIYYVTTLDFEIGSGISEKKSQAKEAEYTIRSREAPKEITDKKNNELQRKNLSCGCKDS